MFVLVAVALCFSRHSCESFSVPEKFFNFLIDGRPGDWHGNVREQLSVIKCPIEGSGVSRRYRFEWMYG